MSDTAGTNGAVDDSKMQKFELYIKASGIDRETKGSCPICQQFFMITCLLGENQDDVDFKVFTVQAECPPKNFAVCWSKKYPVVMVNSGHNKTGQDISGMMYDTFEDLETFFEGINRECPELKRKNAPNQMGLKVIENVYKHFNHFIAGQPDKALVAQLKRLNEYLESQDTRFMVDNVMSFTDCHLLPRMQHIRVAGRHYRDFDIPKEFTYVWRYMQYAYMQDAFRSTIPSDQDIIYHYEKKVPPQYKKMGGLNAKLGKFTYTLEVPEDCKQNLDKAPQEQVLADDDYIPTGPPAEPKAPEEKAPSNDVKEEDTHASGDHDNDKSAAVVTEIMSSSQYEEETKDDDEDKPSSQNGDVNDSTQDTADQDATTTNGEGSTDATTDQVTQQVDAVDISN